MRLCPPCWWSNQNYDADWQVISGQGKVFSSYGLIGVRIPAGHQKLEIAFRSRALMVGLTLTLLAIVATLAIWWFERTRYRARRRFLLSSIDVSVRGN